MNRSLSSIVLASVCALTFSGRALAAGPTLIYVFKAGTGTSPLGEMAADGQGNFYGTAPEGGRGKTCASCGTIFRLSADGSVTNIHSFKGSDGLYPIAGLTRGADGAFYGTTEAGGDPKVCSQYDCGVVFRMTPDGKVKVLYTFPSGSEPRGGVVFDSSGNLYGTTWTGGAGCGTVYKLTPDRQETTLHVFQNDGHDGIKPNGRVAIDEAGNLYGTTSQGGPKNAGTIFKIGTDGKERVFYSFKGADGASPESDLLLDDDGNMYGTTLTGGAHNDGTIFKVTPGGVETVLHSFDESAGDGGFPWSPLVVDPQGNLYGTTAGAGSGAQGSVFKLAPDGTETLLASFTSFKKGWNLRGGLVRDGLGYLYGTTAAGGSKRCQGSFGNGCGTIFRVHE